MVDAAAQPAGPEHRRAAATNSSAAQRREQTQLPDLRQVLGLLVRIDLGHPLARRRGFLLLRLALAELALLALALLPFPGAGELPGLGRLDLLRRRPGLIPGISLLLLVPGERIVAAGRRPDHEEEPPERQERHQQRAREAEV